MRLKPERWMLVLSASMLTFGAQTHAEGEPVMGKRRLFAQCIACHAVTSNAEATK